ncbi:MAG: hypothetical protein LBB55_07010 [Zoogloeaceae bacterium]|jgi:hypothetical protein|nr:hypothetical protein [Zoogloeaceae bacterium]
MKDEYDFSQGKRGANIKSGKTQVTLYLDDEILSVFREWAEREEARAQDVASVS